MDDLEGHSRNLPHGGILLERNTLGTVMHVSHCMMYFLEAGCACWVYD